MGVSTRYAEAGESLVEGRGGTAAASPRWIHDGPAEAYEALQTTGLLPEHAPHRRFYCEACDHYGTRRVARTDGTVYERPCEYCEGAGSRELLLTLATLGSANVLAAEELVAATVARLRGYSGTLRGPETLPLPESVVWALPPRRATDRIVLWGEGSAIGNNLYDDGWCTLQTRDGTVKTYTPLRDLIYSGVYAVEFNSERAILVPLVSTTNL